MATNNSGTYNTVIKAERDLVRTITWLKDDDSAVDLSDYDRVLYNIQTDERSPVEVLIVDSSTDNPDWLNIDDPATGGIINMAIPGVNIPYVHSDSGKWLHELVLFDAGGGQVTVFEGRVTLKRPIASLLDS